MKSKVERYRNWTFELYPESMKENYREILDRLHVQWVESPIHDQDYDEGKLKKPHIHVILAFEGVKTYDQFKNIVKSVNGVSAPLHGKNGDTCVVSSIRGMTRYLIHLDNPEKHQYDKSAIIAHGGFDIAPHFQYPGEMIKRYIQEMMAFCDASSIYEYSDLLDYAQEFKYETWYDLLTIGRQSFVIIKYLDSRRNKERQKAYEEKN